MTSLSSSNPLAYHPDGPSLDTLNEAKIVLEEARHIIPLSHYLVEGVGRGNIEGLKIRPFADFHPVERIHLSTEFCEVHYAKPLRPLQDRRVVRLDEIINLTRQLVEAKRRRVADQRLYLYPGLEAFGIDPSCNRIRFRVINVRPTERFRVSSHDQLSVEALCLLIELYCPDGWALIRSKRTDINTLETLLQLIDRRRSLSTLWSFIKGLFVFSMLMIFLSVPLAIWGPDLISQPLSELMLPRVNHFLDQLEERRAHLKPRATMSIRLTLTLPSELSSEWRTTLHRALSESLKAIVGSNALIVPGELDPHLWVAELKNYRGDPNELLRTLSYKVSHKLVDYRMLMPHEVDLDLSFHPQIALLNPQLPSKHSTTIDSPSLNQPQVDSE